jgi:opacity protein-like surface antigen
MKKFLLLSFLMVAFVSAASFAQVYTSLVYTNNQNWTSSSQGTLDFYISPKNEDGSHTAGAFLFRIPDGKEINLMGVSLTINYTDNTSDNFYNETYGLSSVDLSIPAASVSKVIAATAYYFDVLYMDGHYERFVYEESF